MAKAIITKKELTRNLLIGAAVAEVLGKSEMAEINKEARALKKMFVEDEDITLSEECVDFIVKVITYGCVAITAEIGDDEVNKFVKEISKYIEG